ncbi:MAG TPA: 16S rRNA (cytosine(967)-C(5))-methyltransferase RsmB [bacterium]|nr:16S rRNA (cytosine(967)-C(5))-methyltransferase RsmB [bacterium]
MSEKTKDDSAPKKKAKKAVVKKTAVKKTMAAKPKAKAAVKKTVLKAKSAKPASKAKAKKKIAPEAPVQEKMNLEVPSALKPVIEHRAEEPRPEKIYQAPPAIVQPQSDANGNISNQPNVSSNAESTQSTQPSRQQRPRFEGRPQFSNNRPNNFMRNSRDRHGSGGRPDFRDRSDFRRPDSRPMVNPRDVVSPSRLEAAKALYSMEKGAKISDVLELKRNLKPEDEALLRELVYGCTRQKRLLDYHLNSFCTTAYDQLPIEIKVALRLGIYQLYFLDRIPAHAAVHESVNLAKQGGQEKLSGFVNAVLRTAETKKAERVIKGESDIDTMALTYSHPTWIVKRWAKSMTPEQLQQTLKADNSPHPVYLRVAPGSRSRVIETLGRQNVHVTETIWPVDTLSLKSHEGGLFSGESFQKGEWIVQDWVPQAMLDLLPLNKGQRVWDVCAAPGGKTIGLAWKTGEKGQVMASDASAERRKRLIENVNRIGLKQVSVFDHEITKLSPAQKFDMAWVDAPCSGTGVLSRRADLRWRLMPKDVIEHADQQKDLLVQAQGHLYPKGYLVYSTCSLEREENQRVIEAFMKDYPEFKPVNLKVPEGHPEISGDELGLSFLPNAEHDGGFMSVLSR